MAAGDPLSDQSSPEANTAAPGESAIKAAPSTTIVPQEAREERTSLPPPPVQEAHKERPARLIAGLDRTLAFVVLVLAFLLASFPARNNDVWLHLATGRALLDGSYHFGTDPFAFTTAWIYWVNHSWLFDVALYGLYSGLSGTGLAVLKTLLAVLLAGLLLGLSRQGRGLLVPALCTALAVLALGPWLVLGPIFVSFLFLALTLWFLERGRRKRAAGRANLFHYWPIPVLFAFWVNLDAWFWLGPLVVGLYALGQFLQTAVGPRRDEATGPRPGEPAALGLVFLVGLAACLLNPHHVYAFALPQELIGAALSPFQAAYFRSSSFLNPAGLAYFPLVLLGLFSFALNRAGWRWWRVLLWLPLFGLSAFWAPAIPFFVIVAGPVMALNFQEAMARQRLGAGDEPPVGRWSLEVRTASVLAGLLLVAAAWPGWLQAKPYGRRQWAVAVDPSLKEAALQLARWHQEGKLEAGTFSLNFSPEVGPYLAWFCPEEKFFFDTRAELFPEIAGDFLKVRQALLRGGKDPGWRDILARYRINRLVLSSPDGKALGQVMKNLAGDPREWPLLYLRGGVAIFGWQDPRSEKGNSFANLRLDLAERAFHSSKEPVPPEGPGLFPVRALWWEAFWKAPPSFAPDRDEAALYLDYFEGLLNPLEAWKKVLAAGVVTAGAGRGSLPSLAVGVNLPLQLLASNRRPPSKKSPGPFPMLAIDSLTRFCARQGRGYAAPLLLAVRSGRRAVWANPEDADAYYQLGLAYWRLSRTVTEQNWLARLPKLNQLRQVQAAAALREALRLRPDFIQAHKALAVLYDETGFRDLGLKHWKEAHAYLTQAGPGPNLTAAEFAGRVKKREEDLQKKVQEVRALLDELALTPPPRGALARARRALDQELGGKALDELLASDITDFGQVGMSLELQLDLLTGRVRAAAKELQLEKEPALGRPSFRWLSTQLAAALGNYEKADQELRQMVNTHLRIEFFKEPLTIRQGLSFILAKAIGESSPAGAGAGWLAHMAYHQGRTYQLSRGLTEELLKESEARTLRGLLALEAGRVVQARQAFRAALFSFGEEKGEGGKPPEIVPALSAPYQEIARQALDWCR